MTIKTTMRRIAFAAIALGALGAASAFAQSAPGIDISNLPPGVRDGVLNALGNGDYDGASKLLQSAPEARLAMDSDATLPKPPDSRWESLKSCGYYPQLTRLECTVEITQFLRPPPPPRQFGPFGGPVGGWGSQENVDFCVNILPIDFNPIGAGHFHAWLHVGRGTVIVHDQPTVSPYSNARGPFDYAVYRDTDPSTGARTQLNGLNTTATISPAWTYEVKAILWWHPILDAVLGIDPLVNCNYTPAYGDIKTFFVQGDPAR